MMAERTYIVHTQSDVILALLIFAGYTFSNEEMPIAKDGIAKTLKALGTPWCDHCIDDFKEACGGKARELWAKLDGYFGLDSDEHSKTSAAVRNE